MLCHTTSLHAIRPEARAPLAARTARSRAPLRLIVLRACAGDPSSSDPLGWAALRAERSFQRSSSLSSGKVPPPKTTMVNNTMASVVVISIGAAVLVSARLIASANAIAPRSPDKRRTQCTGQASPTVRSHAAYVDTHH